MFVEVEALKSHILRRTLIVSFSRLLSGLLQLSTFHRFKQVTFKTQTNTTDQPARALGTKVPPHRPLPATPPYRRGSFSRRCTGIHRKRSPRKRGEPAPASRVPGDSERGREAAVHSGKAAKPSALFPAPARRLVSGGPQNHCGSRLAGFPRRRLAFPPRVLARAAVLPTPPACLGCAL